MRKPFLETGRVVGTHGVKGELRVQPWSDSPAFKPSISTAGVSPVSRWKRPAPTATWCY